MSEPLLRPLLSWIAMPEHNIHFLLIIYLAFFQFFTNMATKLFLIGHKNKIPQEDWHLPTYFHRNAFMAAGLVAVVILAIIYTARAREHYF
jgi:hypothetical protein